MALTQEILEPSISANEDAWEPLGTYVESQDMPDDHRAAWRDLLQRRPTYTNASPIPPLRRPSYHEKPRTIIAAQFVWPSSRRGRYGAPLGLWLHDGNTATLISLECEQSAADDVALTLFSHSRRGAMVVWPFGEAGDFHALLRLYLPALLEAGYKIEPGTNANSLRWLRVTKSRHVWWLCDWQAVTNTPAAQWRQWWPRHERLAPGSKLTPYTALRCLANLARILAATYGVTLRPTLAGAAMSAFTRHMPEDLWVWRPPSLMVSMCRVGLGYRGGYVAATAHQAPAHKWDVNRMYSWALTQWLPARWAFGKALAGRRLEPGLYMCTVSGRGKMPAYLGVFSPGSNQWAKRYCREGRHVAILATPEIRALRRLGYEVAPEWGYIFGATFNMAQYVGKLEEQFARYGRSSAEARLARDMGNLAYGRLAQSPGHDRAIYALRRPSPAWAPMLDNLGREIPYLWQIRAISYAACQHVEIAAVICAHARGSLYKGLAAVMRAGAQVVYVDTDCIVTNRLARPPGPVSDTTIGAWRYLGADEHCVIVGRKQYVFGGEARFVGVRPAGLAA